MARGRKMEALTPEERLQAALVPESEQPYKVPENWCWIHLGELYQINPKNLAEDFVDAAFIPMEKIAPGFVNEYSFDVQPWCKAKKGHTQFADGDVAFAKISPCFENRKSMLLNNLPNGIGGGTTELIILRQSHMNQKYTFWFISQEQFIRGGIATYSGTVGQQRISMDYVRTYPIPVPPLAEQQRIVDRIESLFAKLDEAKQKAQDALDSFETRKAAILHKAFTGELTAQWRKEHGVGMESWENLKIGTYAQVKGGKRLPKGHKLVTERTAHPYLRIADFGDGTINDSDLHYITEDAFSQIKNYIINKEDVYISIVGSIGKAGVIPESLNGANLTENAARIISSRTLPRYLSSFLSSPKAQNDIQNRIRSATLGKLSLLNIKDIETPIPSIEEQTEIIRILDDLLSKEQQAKEAAAGVLEQIDLIKKAILASAFRGELGTNDPSEESAVELLKQVL